MKLNRIYILFISMCFSYTIYAQCPSVTETPQLDSSLPLEFCDQTTVDLTNYVLNSSANGALVVSTSTTVSSTTDIISDISQAPIPNNLYFYFYDDDAECRGDANGPVTFTTSSSPDAGVGSTVNRCNVSANGNTSINLFDALTGEDTGGDWAQPTSNPQQIGNFNPTTVDFDSALAGNYRFTYTVHGTGVCSDASAIVTVVVSDCAESGCPITKTPILDTTKPTDFCDQTTVDLTDYITNLESGDDLVVSQSTTVSSTVDIISDITQAPIPNSLYFYFYDSDMECRGDALGPIEFTANTTPNAGTDGSMDICNDSSDGNTVLNLFEIITDEDNGGSWSQQPNNPELFDTYDPTNLDFNGFMEGQYIFTYRINGSGACSSASATATITVSDCGAGTCPITASVFLEGALNVIGLPNYGTEMRTHLNSDGLLPGQTPTKGFGVPTPAGQPYNNDFHGYSGAEGINMTSYDSDVADWVLVDLRTSINGLNVCRQAGLLYKDGTIEFDDNFCSCPINDGDMVYIVVHHRNHLAVASPLQEVTDGVVSFDFRSQESFKDGFNRSSKLIREGVYAMFAGNNFHGTPGQAQYNDINANDIVRWRLNNSFNDIYINSDMDMNADVNSNDKFLLILNNGFSVPITN